MENSEKYVMQILNRDAAKMMTPFEAKKKQKKKSPQPEGEIMLKPNQFQSKVDSK
jgi:hypothetical protein